VKFYLGGHAVLVFDIEAVFLYPWVVVYREFKMAAFVEMLIFIALVFAGFLYVWKKGALDWSGEDPSVASVLPGGTHDVAGGLGPFALSSSERWGADGRDRSERLVETCRFLKG